VLDGEAVVLGVDGVSDFDALVSRMHDDEVQLCAFDLLALEGDDQRSLPAKTGSSRRHGRGFSADPGPRHSPSADRYGVFTLNQAQGRESHLILPASTPQSPSGRKPPRLAAPTQVVPLAARGRFYGLASTQPCGTSITLCRPLAVLRSTFYE
jgi:hypothetical protein